MLNKIEHFFQVLLHDNNEFLNERIFLKGIDIFCDVICKLASAWNWEK